MGVPLPSVDISPGGFHLLCSRAGFSKGEAVEREFGGEMEHLGLQSRREPLGTSLTS